MKSISFIYNIFSFFNPAVANSVYVDILASARIAMTANVLTQVSWYGLDHGRAFLAERRTMSGNRAVTAASRRQAARR